MKWYLKKPRNDGLLDVSVEVINDEETDQQGDFVVHVINGMEQEARAPIVLESNLPLVFEDDRRVMNPSREPSTMVTSKEITVPGGQSVDRVFHWVDPDDSLKFLRVQARFFTARSAWIDI